MGSTGEACIMQALDAVLPTADKAETASQVQQKLNVLTRGNLFKLVELTPQTVVKEILSCVASMSAGDPPKLQKDPVKKLKDYYDRFPYFCVYTGLPAGSEPRLAGKAAWLKMMEQLDKVEVASDIEAYVNYSWLGTAADKARITAARDVIMERAAARAAAKGEGKAGGKPSKGKGKAAAAKAAAVAS